MASTFSTNIRLTKQGDGDNPNSWGTVLNTQVVSMIDEAITAYTTVSCSSGNITLTVANGSTDQARSAILEFVGTVSAATNIIIPDKDKFYVINDRTTRENDAVLTLKTNSGSGKIVALTEKTVVFCDGVSVWCLNEAGFNLDTTYARLAVANTFTAINTFTDLSSFTSATSFNTSVSIADLRVTQGYADRVSVSAAEIVNASVTRGIMTQVTLTDAASIAIDLNLGNNFIVTLAGNRAISNPTNPTVGQTGQVYVIQDGTGSRTLTYPSNFRYAGGTSPTLTTDANAVDLLVYNVRSATEIDVVFLADFKASS